MQREILDDSITRYLKTFFENRVDALRTRWTEYEQVKNQDGSFEPHGKKYVVFEDLQEQIASTITPTIEIVAKGCGNEIFSIGTQEELFNYDIIVTTNNNHPVESSRYCRIIAHSLFEQLNQFNVRAFKVPNTNFCVYYSEAKTLEYNFRRGKGLRSAKFQWQAKLLKEQVR